MGKKWLLQGPGKREIKGSLNNSHLDQRVPCRTPGKQTSINYAFISLPRPTHNFQHSYLANGWMGQPRGSQPTRLQPVQTLNVLLYFIGKQQMAIKTEQFKCLSLTDKFDLRIVIRCRCIRLPSGFVTSIRCTLLFCLFFLLFALYGWAGSLTHFPYILTYVLKAATFNI